MHDILNNIDFAHIVKKLNKKRKKGNNFIFKLNKFKVVFLIPITCIIWPLFDRNEIH